MKRWGVAIIGCGSIGSFHLQALKEIEEANLIGIQSRSSVKAKEIGEREGCLWTTDYHELLDHPEVELICLTSSSGSHASIGLEAMRAGKHLLVEKPMAMSEYEANLMIETAHANKVTLSVVSQRRFELYMQEIKRIVAMGAIGELLYVEAACPYLRDQAYYDSAPWRGTIAEDGGALMNQGIHTIDLMLWMAGPAAAVFGKTATQTHRMEAEDFALALITFRSGAYGKLLASTSFQPGFPQSLHLFGTKGTIKLEGNRIIHWSVPGVEKPNDESEAFQEGGTRIPTSFPIDCHKRQIKDWIESVASRRLPLVTGEDGRNCIALIEAVYASALQGNEITLK